MVEAVDFFTHASSIVCVLKLLNQVMIGDGCRYGVIFFLEHTCTVCVFYAPRASEREEEESQLISTMA